MADESLGGLQVEVVWFHPASRVRSSPKGDLGRLEDDAGDLTLTSRRGENRRGAYVFGYELTPVSLLYSCGLRERRLYGGGERVLGRVYGRPVDGAHVSATRRLGGERILGGDLLRRVYPRELPGR